MVLKKNRGHYRIKPDKYQIKLGGTTLVSASAVPPKCDPVVVRLYRRNPRFFFRTIPCEKPVSPRKTRGTRFPRSVATWCIVFICEYFEALEFFRGAASRID